VRGAGIKPNRRKPSPPTAKFINTERANRESAGEKLELDEFELKSTFKAKQKRLQRLLDFIKDKKQVSMAEIYRYMFKLYLLSSATIDRYLKDLQTSGLIKVKAKSESYPGSPWMLDPEERIVVYTGGEENE
jgi:predicted HTH transcriptional regulator